MPQFDIFKRLQDGNFFWVASDNDFQSAKQRLDHLCSLAPGHYLIHSQEEGFILELNNTLPLTHVA